MPMFDAAQWNLDDSYEPEALPDGTEAHLRIIKVTKGVDKNKLAYFLPTFDVPEYPTAKEFTYFLHIPDTSTDATGLPRMEEKRLNQARNNMKNFLECFEIDTSRPFDPEDDWPGHSGWAILGLSEDPQYGEQNRIKKLLTAA